MDNICEGVRVRAPRRIHTVVSVLSTGFDRLERRELIRTFRIETFPVINHRVNHRHRRFVHLSRFYDIVNCCGALSVQRPKAFTVDIVDYTPF